MSRLVKVRRPAVKRSVAVTGAAGRCVVNPLAVQWAAAADERGQAAAVWRAARAELARVRASRLADFKAGTRGLRAGWLSGH